MQLFSICQSDCVKSQQYILVELWIIKVLEEWLREEVKSKCIEISEYCL